MSLRDLPDVSALLLKKKTFDSHDRNVEIPVAVIVKEIRVADLCQVTLLCVVNLINIKLGDVFRTKQRWCAKTSRRLVQVF